MSVSLICPGCQTSKRTSTMFIECANDVELRGIVRCLICNYELPITMRNGMPIKIDDALPGTQSDQLNSSVPIDVKEDLKEAERAHYNLCDKACVTMCRRALQLGLIDIGIEDKSLSSMLKEAYDKNKIEANTYQLATSIKGYGDIGAHRRDKLNSQEVSMVIYATVKMLNELFGKT